MALQQLLSPLPVLPRTVPIARPVAMAAPGSPESAYLRFVKPLFDSSLAFVGLVVLLPVAALVALVVRIGLGPGVLFRQRRVGIRGGEFTVFKFRTMLDEAPAGARRGPCPEHGHKCPDDPRHTRTGKLLRKLSLDELP
ncbi:MAG: hypothetical protein QOE80_1751, partial [Actinomycetota bacterium]|nr:hypothetical protein [Actinomycetota bacterium]